MKTYTYKNEEFTWGGGLNIYKSNIFLPLTPYLNNGCLSWMLSENVRMSIIQLKKVLKNEK